MSLLNFNAVVKEEGAKRNPERKNKDRKNGKGRAKESQRAR